MRCRGAVIEQVGARTDVKPAANHRSLGEVVVLPGLVNAHTHLEFTHLRGQLPKRRPLAQWLFAMIRHSPKGIEQHSAVADGADQALATGTTALIDTCHNHRAWKTLKDTPLRKLCLAEVAGIGPTRHGAIAKLTEQIKGNRCSAKMQFGIAPHAPYSTDRDVYAEAVKLAHKKGWPVATHLGETESERQFLLHGSGKLFELLARLGMIDSSVTIHGCKPSEFAYEVGMFRAPSILAHMNCIDDEELILLSGSDTTVVYCPGASEFFGRSGHRYPDMIAAGVNVALGTDGLACNDSLSMLAEMQRMRKEARVDNDTILRMATLNGAAAMGLADKIGTLEPGKQADWIAIGLPGETSGPLETILTSQLDVLETHIAGKKVYSRG